MKPRGTCRKLRYRDQVAALIALSRAEVKAKRNSHIAKQRRENRVYECPRCRGWHLTSEEGSA
jgi:hypothetical protein